VLATPAASTGDWRFAALAAGRHVLVEKPLALDVGEALDVAATGERLGLTVMVGHTFLYSPPVTRLRRYLREGELGARSSTCTPAPQPRKDQERLATPLWNLAPHDVSIMLHLLDECRTRCRREASSFIQPSIEDVCFAQSGVPVGSGRQPPCQLDRPSQDAPHDGGGRPEDGDLQRCVGRSEDLLFDAGVASGRQPVVGDYATMGEFQWRTRAGDIMIPNITMSEPLLAEVEDFGRCCETGDTPLTHARHGVDVRPRPRSHRRNRRRQHGPPGETRLMIRFLDLERLHQSIRPDLDRAFDSVVRGSGFVGAKTCRRFEEEFAGGAPERVRCRVRLRYPMRSHWPSCLGVVTVIEVIVTVDDIRDPRRSGYPRRRELRYRSRTRHRTRSGAPRELLLEAATGLRATNPLHARPSRRPVEIRADRLVEPSKSRNRIISRVSPGARAGAPIRRWLRGRDDVDPVTAVRERCVARLATATEVLHLGQEWLRHRDVRDHDVAGAGAPLELAHGCVVAQRRVVRPSDNRRRTARSSDRPTHR